MDVNKLNVRNDDIDKNTGRIILPSSTELEEINSGGSKNVMQATPFVSTQSETATPKPLNSVAPMSAKPMAPREEPVKKTGQTPDMTPTDRRAVKKQVWEMSPMMVASLCLFFFTLPLGLICAFFIYENSQFRNQVDGLNQRLMQIEKRSETASARTLREKTASKAEFEKLKQTLVQQIQSGAVSAQVGSADVSEKVEKAETKEFVYMDEDGNIISEEEVATGDYVVEE